MQIKPKDEKIMVALLSTGNVTEAGKLAGVSRATIHKRLRDEAFKAEYNHRRAMLLEEACGAMQSTLAEAVTTIRQIIKDEDNSPQVRLNACALILQNSLKYIEQIEIVKELEKLEKIVNETN